MPQNSKMLIGAVVAAALAIAVYYGLITQQSANNIQSQANQTLGTSPANQQPASPTPQAPATQAPTTQTPAPAGPVTQTPTQTPHQ